MAIVACAGERGDQPQRVVAERVASRGGRPGARRAGPPRRSTGAATIEWSPTLGHAPVALVVVAEPLVAHVVARRRPAAPRGPRGRRARWAGPSAPPRRAPPHDPVVERRARRVRPQPRARQRLEEVEPGPLATQEARRLVDDPVAGRRPGPRRACPAARRSRAARAPPRPGGRAPRVTGPAPRSAARGRARPRTGRRSSRAGRRAPGSNASSCVDHTVIAPNGPWSPNSGVAMTPADALVARVGVGPVRRGRAARSVR